MVLDYVVAFQFIFAVLCFPMQKKKSRSFFEDSLTRPMPARTLFFSIHEGLDWISPQQYVRARSFALALRGVWRVAWKWKAK